MNFEVKFDLGQKRINFGVVKNTVLLKLLKYLFSNKGMCPYMIEYMLKYLFKPSPVIQMH